MLDILIVLIVVASSIWIYLDATSHKIGKVDGGGLFNISAGLWATATLLIWIIAFPAYLIKRKQLIETAKENPVEVNGRGWKTGVLSVIGGLWFLSTLAAVPVGNPGVSSAIQVIKESLKNPDSFELKSSNVLWSGPYKGYTAYLTLVEYAAQNGFGATIRECHIAAFYEDETTVYPKGLEACPGSQTYKEMALIAPDMTLDKYLGLLKNVHFPDDSLESRTEQ